MPNRTWNNGKGKQKLEDSNKNFEEASPQKDLKLDRLLHKMYDKSHGCKAMRGPRLPVTEQGNNFDYYHSGRDEPVPPCPTFSSACKTQFAVPPSPETVIKYIAPAGVPLKRNGGNKASKTKVNFWTVERERTFVIPSPGFRDITVVELPKTISTTTTSTPDAPNLQSESSPTSSPVNSSMPVINEIQCTSSPVEETTSEEIEPKITTTANNEEQEEEEEEDEPIFTNDTENVEFCVTSIIQIQETELQAPFAPVFPGRGRGRGIDRRRVIMDCMGVIPIFNDDIHGETQNVEPYQKPQLLKTFIELNHGESFVRIISVSSSLIFKIATTDLVLIGKRSKLESDMFKWFEANKDRIIHTENPKCFDYYVIVDKTKNKRCCRVRLLSLDDVYKTAEVERIDHGSVITVFIDDLMLLQDDWKVLPQMTCQAKCNEFSDKMPDRAFDFCGKFERVNCIDVETICEERGGEIYMEQCAILSFLSSALILELEMSTKSAPVN